MPKRIIEPNTTLYPVPIVLITAGGQAPNVMTCNLIWPTARSTSSASQSMRSRSTHTQCSLAWFRPCMLMRLYWMNTETWMYRAFIASSTAMVQCAGSPHTIFASTICVGACDTVERGV